MSPVDISGSIVMGDEAYGTQKIRDYIASRGASYAIPPKANTLTVGVRLVAIQGKAFS